MPWGGPVEDLPIERLSELFDGLGGALLGFIETHGVSNDEWYTLLGLLTEVGRADEFTLLSDVLRLSVAVDGATHPAADGATPSNVPGPFWRPGAPVLDSPARIGRPDEPGTPLVVAGAVRGPDGQPVAGALLDVWQNAATGRYDADDDSQPDMNLRARVRADGAGRYEIRTIRPIPYEVPMGGPVGAVLRRLERSSWRPAHVHFRVQAPGFQDLTTMVFFTGDPWLGRDAIGAVKEALVVPVLRRDDGAHGAVETARFDFTLRTASEGPAASGRGGGAAARPA